MLFRSQDSMTALLSHVDKYDVRLKETEELTFFMVDKDIHVHYNTAVIDRPMQEKVTEGFHDYCGMLGKMGKGWSKEKCMSWFKANVEHKDGSQLSSSQDNDGNLYIPKSMGRSIASKYELEESHHILKSLSTILLDYDNPEQGKGYSMTCNVEGEIESNPELETDRKSTRLNSSHRT